MRIIKANELRSLLPMAECIEVIEEAMKYFSTGKVEMPQRSFIELPQQSDSLLIMPGFSSNPEAYGLKVLGLHPNNTLRNIPTINGFMAIFDSNTGGILAIMDGAELTAIRTAAASAVATRALASMGAKTHGIFGTGVQAINHIDAISCVRPIDEVLLWGRNYEAAIEIANEQSIQTGQNIRAVNDPSVVAQCDIVTTATSSKNPILKGDWIKPGTHINAVGAHSKDSRELDTQCVKKSKAYTDYFESAESEGGDFLIPAQEGEYKLTDLVGEIGSVLIKDVDGRLDEREITLYKSHGIVIQDLFAAYHVYESAERNNCGLIVELSE